MLKIKDDVDLKELEKFGFEYNENEKEYHKKISDSEIIEIQKWGHEQKNQIHLFIDDEYYNCWTNDNSFDLIFDLIQAGLVEKVGDE